MSKILRLLLFFLSIYLLLITEKSFSSSIGNEYLRKKLEVCYSNYSKALKLKSFKYWQKYTAEHRIVSVRNYILSQGMSYPTSIFRLNFQLTDIKKLRFVKTFYKLQTAVSIYIGKFLISNDSNKHPNVMMLMYFIKENDGWKFDKKVLLNTQSSKIAAKKLNVGDYSDFETGVLAPLNEPPKVPKKCNVPEIIGAVRINIKNVKIKLELNDFHKKILENESSFDIIIGGLKNGVNKFKLTILEKDNQNIIDNKILINIYKIFGGKKALVYQYKASGYELRNDFNNTFVVKRK